MPGVDGERQGMGMGKGKAIPAWAYKAAIVVATIIWGYSFVAMKDVVSVLPPAWLLGFRFTFAGVLLTARAQGVLGPHVAGRRSAWLSGFHGVLDTDHRP